MSDGSSILVRPQGDVVLSLCRPERRKAIDRATVDALHGALDGGYRLRGLGRSRAEDDAPRPRWPDRAPSPAPAAADSTDARESASHWRSLLVPGSSALEHRSCLE